MKSRGYIATFITTALMVFIITGFLCLLLESLVEDISLTEFFEGNILNRYSPYIALVFAIAFGLVTASSFKHISTSFYYSDRATFLLTIVNLMLEIGYHKKGSAGNKVIFKPSARVSTFAGKISVEMSDSMAKIEGPKAFINILKNLYEAKKTHHIEAE